LSIKAEIDALIDKRQSETHQAEFNLRRPLKIPAPKVSVRPREAASGFFAAIIPFLEVALIRLRVD